MNKKLLLVIGAIFLFLTINCNKPYTITEGDEAIQEIQSALSFMGKNMKNIEPEYIIGDHQWIIAREYEDGTKDIIYIASKIDMSFRIDSRNAISNAKVRHGDTLRNIKFLENNIEFEREKLQQTKDREAFLRAQENYYTKKLD